MRIPLLDLKAQHATIREEVYAAIERVVEDQWFIMGPEVKAFEEEVARYTGVSYGIGVSSGTDALLAALMALGVGPGDEVITTPYTFFATAGVVARLGAVPVFADIDRHTFNMREDEAIERITPRTKAIISVHLFGRIAPMRALKEAAQRGAIHLIEDAAQAIGARTIDGRSAGQIGEMTCFSFFPSKNLGGFGDGGMIVTDDESLSERLRILRAHGSQPKYHHEVVGGNFRLDAIQAAVLRVKLPHLNQWSAARRANAARYRALFETSEVTDIVAVPPDEDGMIYNQFVIRVPARDAVQAALAADGVATEVYYPVPLHLQPCFRHLGYQRGAFPEAEAAALESLALPIYPELSEEQIAWVVDRLVAALATAGATR